MGVANSRSHPCTLRARRVEATRRSPFVESPMLPARLRCVALATLALSIGACSDAPTAPSVQNDQTNSGGKGTTAAPVVNAPIELLHLTGGGFVTESYVHAHGETLHGLSSSILAATGPMTEPNGRCCRVT